MMKGIVYYVLGLLLLSIGPQLILGAIFTVGIYYVLYLLFTGLFSGSNSSGSGGSCSDDSDAGDHWNGTGNPYV